MHPEYKYATVLEAITELRKAGFTVDFNLGAEALEANDSKYETEDFEITEVYRYEGDSDPEEESTVYGIESKIDGVKGILVTSYGMYTDKTSEKLLKKLKLEQ